MEELPNLLTQGGVAIVVLLLVGVVKTTLPAFDSSRFGAIVAIVLGIGLVVLANATSVADIRLSPVEVLLTGILGGAAASGIYSAGKGGASTPNDGGTDG